MRRWNGWGDEDIHMDLPASAAQYLAGIIGEGTPHPDATHEAALTSVPESRLPSHQLVYTDAQTRLLHARGQSLPDWVALRYGRIGTFPDGVAFPATQEEVRSLLEFARVSGSKVIPYGGGTSVVGHINPLPGDAPVLSLDMSRMHKLLSLDTISQLATFESGISGPDLEAQLNSNGYTLGHFPQSFEGSTLGGWIASRSCGQQSFHYGRIGRLFAGGHVETPVGPLDLLPIPSTAAGPDLRQFILGSEGRLGVITKAVMRVRPLPEFETFYGVFFHDWEAGVEAVRSIVHHEVRVSMLRLSDALETETTLALAGRERLVRYADRGLSFLRYGTERCLLIFGVTGNQAETRLARRQATRIARAHGGLFTGPMIGRIWRKTRFRTPYLRNTLWEGGYALDTVETAVPWSAVLDTAKSVKKAIRGGLEHTGEKVLAFAHLSHIYHDGASVYVTFFFRRTHDPEETLSRWQSLKAAASNTILAHGGTISHQHGVGTDHASYLESENGKVGMSALSAVVRELDPEGLLNPGKLLIET